MNPSLNPPTKSTPIRAEAPVLEAWQEQLTQAADKPWLAALLRHGRQIFQRFAYFYEWLQTLPRRLRRRLTRRVTKLGTSLAGAALMLALTGAPILAGTITVDNTTCILTDAITTANSDTNTNGCTISGTVGGADTIELPANSAINLTEVNSNYLGDNGLPVISSTITIAGNGATIQRSDVITPFRIMAVNSDGNLTLDDVTLSNGKTSGNTDGGGLLNTGTTLISSSTISGNTASGFGGGGGAYNFGSVTTATLTLSNSTISGNMARDGGGVGNRANNFPATLTITNSAVSGNSANDGYGGGVVNSDSNAAATVTINNSAISGNSANDNGGGVANFTNDTATTLTLDNSAISGNTARSGGGVYNYAYSASAVTTLTLTNSAISGNSATGANSTGGGVFNYAFYGSISATINNSTISGNSSKSEGGGIFNYAYYGSISATINNSTISGNSATRAGGGVYNTARYDSASATLTLTNSTLSGNSANSGGGLYNYGYGGPASVTFNNSTISGNSATSGGGVLNNADEAAGAVTFNRSLVSGNTGSSGREVSQASDPQAVINANNDNLFGHSGLTNGQAFSNFSPSGSDITATGNGSTPAALADILDTTLQNNGGETATHNLVSGSPALDAAPTGPPTDQRGMTRPLGAAFDIGAVEFDNEAPVISAVTLISPTGAINTPRPTFTWSPASDSSGVMSYTLLLTDSNGLTTTVTTTGPSYTPPTDLATGDYTWTVKAHDVAGNASDYVNPAASFTLTTNSGGGIASQVYLPIILRD